MFLISNPTERARIKPSAECFEAVYNGASAMPVHEANDVSQPLAMDGWKISRTNRAQQNQGFQRGGLLPYREVVLCQMARYRKSDEKSLSRSTARTVEETIKIDV